MNKKNPIDRIDYCCYSEFIEDVLYSVDHVNFDECDSVSIIAKYKETVDVLEYLICNDIIIHAITMLEPEYYCGYDKEFIITINEDGICVEPMWRNAYGTRPAGYLYDESTVCYVFGNCRRQVLDYIEAKVVVEVNIGFKDDEVYEDDFRCNNDCANCNKNEDVGVESELDAYLDTLKNFKPKSEFVKYSNKPKVEKIKMDDDMKGFSISTSDDYGYSSFSFYSTDENLVKEMLKKHKKF